MNDPSEKSSANRPADENAAKAFSSPHSHTHFYACLFDKAPPGSCFSYGTLRYIEQVRGTPIRFAASCDQHLKKEAKTVSAQINEAPHNTEKNAFWRRAFQIEATGLRTAGAAVAPLIGGQVVHQPGAGLLIGLGGLYVCVADKDGAKADALLLTAAGSALATLVGTVAGFHPLLSVGLMFLWAMLLGMMGIFGPIAGQVGYVISLVFVVTLGLPAPRHAGLERMAEFGIGGLWSVALTLILWRVIGHRSLRDEASEKAPRPPASPAEAWQRWKENFTIRSPDFRHALRLAIATAFAVAVYKSLRLDHGYWLALTALVILKRDWAATKQRALERIAASCAGGALGAALAFSVHNVLALDGLLLLLCVLAYSNLPRHYGLYVFFLTPFVVVMINTVAPGDWQIALLRIGYTLAGGVMALLVAAALRLQENH